MMQKNLELIAIVRESNSNFEADNVIGAQMITKINRHGHNQERLFIITDYNAYLFVPGILARSAKISRFFRWDTLLSIKSESIDRLDLTFKSGVMNLIDPNAIQIVVTIASHIQNIMPRYEWPVFDFKQEYLDGYNRSSDAMIQRLRFKAYSAGRELPETLITEMTEISKKILKTGEQTSIQSLNLSKFTNFYAYTDLILKAIEVNPPIKKIVVPSFPGHPYWSFLAEFMKTNRTITFLDIYDEINIQLFQAFVNACASNPNAKLNKILFHQGKYDSVFVVNLAIVLESCKIQGLILENGLTQDGYQTLIPMLQTVKGYNQLTSLYLTKPKCSNISAHQLIAPLRNLKFLKLEECGIDVTDVFNVIGGENSGTCQIRELFLAKNKMVMPIDPNYVFPKTLVNIQLDDISFENGALEQFLTVFAPQIDAKSKVSLSLSRIKMDQTQLSSLDEFFSTFHINIFSLIYDQNRLSNGFFQFLNNSSIHSLSLRGCLTKGDPMCKPFADSIAKNTSIVDLNLSGIENQGVLGESIGIVLNGIMVNDSIQIFNVSNNSTGNVICVYLLELLKENFRIKELSFDSNCVTDAHSMIDFFSEVNKLKKPILIHIPQIDITSMRNAKLITDKDLKELWMIIKKIQRSNEKGESTMTGTTGGIGGTNASNNNKKNEMPLIRSSSLQDLGSILTENEQPENVEIDPKDQIVIDRVNEEYVSDQQWESLLDEVPETNIEDKFLEFIDKYSLINLLSEIRYV